MRKSILLATFFVVYAVPAFAVDYTALTFAEDTYTNTFTGNQPQITDSNAAPIDFTLSPNVGINYNVNGTADAYTLVSANAQGTKAYGIQSDFQGVLMTTNDAPVGVSAPEVDAWTTSAIWEVMGSPSAPLPGEDTTG
jgi:hypothetical protein